ncbi:MAG: hypothetical protein WCL37_04570 [Chrysiogenales bacterium]
MARFLCLDFSIKKIKIKFPGKIVTFSGRCKLFPGQNNPAVGIAGHAQALVSGNKIHFPKQNKSMLSILLPKEFSDSQSGI